MILQLIQNSPSSNSIEKNGLFLKKDFAKSYLILIFCILLLKCSTINGYIWWVSLMTLKTRHNKTKCFIMPGFLSNLIFFAQLRRFNGNNRQYKH